MPPTPRSYIVISERLHCRRFCKLVLVVVGANQSVCVFCTEHVLLFRSVVGWQYQILCWVLILGTYIYSLVMEIGFFSNVKLNVFGLDLCFCRIMTFVFLRLTSNSHFSLQL